jgi:hypothetical protein
LVSDINKIPEAKAKFMESAKIFVEIQDLQEHDRKFSGFAINILVQIQEWVLAADICLKENEFRKAGELYFCGKKYVDSANAFGRASI